MFFQLVEIQWVIDMKSGRYLFQKLQMKHLKIARRLIITYHLSLWSTLRPFTPDFGYNFFLILIWKIEVAPRHFFDEQAKQIDVLSWFHNTSDDVYRHSFLLYFFYAFDVACRPISLIRWQSSAWRRIPCWWIATRRIPTLITFILHLWLSYYYFQILNYVLVYFLYEWFAWHFLRKFKF